MKVKRAILVLSLIFVLTSCSNLENIEELALIPTEDIMETKETIEEETEDVIHTEDYGSQGALNNTEFTIEEMLNYALQDEYTARAEYEYIMDVYGTQNPFENIMASEETHISLLLPLYETYNIEILSDTSSEHLFEFSSINEAYEIGVIAEINNIAMYNLFLEQENLPSDIEDVFIKLRDASINHLDAFTKQVEKS